MRWTVRTSGMALCLGASLLVAAQAARSQPPAATRSRLGPLVVNAEGASLGTLRLARETTEDALILLLGSPRREALQVAEGSVLVWDRAGVSATFSGGGLAWVTLELGRARQSPRRSGPGSVFPTHSYRGDAQLFGRRHTQAAPLGTPEDMHCQNVGWEDWCHLSHDVQLVYDDGGRLLRIQVAFGEYARQPAD